MQRVHNRDRWMYLEDAFGVIPAGEKLVYLNPTEPFNLYLKVGALAGLFVTSPVVLFQVWMFISPGLYRNEKRYVFPFMFSTVALFLSGGHFGYKMVYPQPSISSSVTASSSSR